MTPRLEAVLEKTYYTEFERGCRKRGLWPDEEPRHYRNVSTESWIGTSSTTGVAAAKLSNGAYLVGLSKSGGRKYGFYTASSITGPYTFQNASSIGYWGETGNIVTECGTGDLYLFQMEGYGSSDDVDYVHLYKIVS